VAVKARAIVQFCVILFYSDRFISSFGGVVTLYSRDRQRTGALVIIMIHAP
jgi:hypothetical protein